jgi:hypothetical protein
MEEAGMKTESGKAGKRESESACFVHFDGWGRFAVPAFPAPPPPCAGVQFSIGRMEDAEILDETEKRFRVRFLEAWPRGDEGDIRLVPKWAVTKREILHPKS